MVVLCFLRDPDKKQRYCSWWYLEFGLFWFAHKRPPPFSLCFRTPHSHDLLAKCVLHAISILPTGQIYTSHWPTHFSNMWILDIDSWSYCLCSSSLTHLSKSIDNSLFNFKGFPGFWRQTCCLSFYDRPTGWWLAKFLYQASLFLRSVWKGSFRIFLGAIFLPPVCEGTLFSSISFLIHLFITHILIGHLDPEPLCQVSHHSFFLLNRHFFSLQFMFPVSAVSLFLSIWFLLQLRHDLTYFASCLFCFRFTLFGSVCLHFFSFILSLSF